VRLLLTSACCRFIIAHWSDADNEDTLCVLIPKLVSSGALTGSHGGKDNFNIPQSWQDQIVSKFERLEVSPFPEQASTATSDKDPQIWHDRCLSKYGALLEILECTTVHPSTNAWIAEIILRKLKLALRPSSALAPAEAYFIVGRGFKAFCRMTRGTGEVDISLGPLLRAAAQRYSRLPNFLEAMISYEDLSSWSLVPTAKILPSSLDSSKWSADSDGDIDVLLASLVDNLSTEQHELRLLSLRLLDNKYRKFNGTSSEALATMLLIEQTPLDLQSSRLLSMHIRTLASIYKQHSLDPLLRRAIPFFFFGMLTVKFSKMWEDASAALAQIAETNDGENIIAEVAFRWLETASELSDGSARNIEQARNTGLTNFECSNIMKLENIFQSVQTELKKAQSFMLQKFVNEEGLIAALPAAARSQALRVLQAVPQIAERHSRQLVPMFLSWAGQEESLESEPTPSRSDWTRKDQKAQLDLFSKFTNPKVLYRSVDVYTALLVLLTNGDLDIQKSALKAILTWKSPSLKPYEENLHNLLDEARFKDEITLLLQGDTLIQPQHRPELIPVLLRLLFGRTVSKKGAASGKQGMEARRLVVLRHLSVEDMDEFLSIALGELRIDELFKDYSTGESVFEKEIMSVRRQVGFVHMMEDVLRELGSNVEPFTPKILPAILYCLIFAARQLQKATDSKDDDESAVSNASMLRVIRQIGFKCLNLLFTNDAQFDWALFVPIILEELVCPRIEKLPTETGQGVSGVLQLLSTWSLFPRTILFLGKDDRFLPKVAECIVPQKSKDEVKLFALGIIKNLMVFARGSMIELETLAATVRSALLDKNMDTFLAEIGNVLRNQQDLSKDLLQDCVETVSELAQFVSRSTQAYNLVDISIFLLDQPSRRVSPKTKSGLLQVLERFVPLYNLQHDSALSDRVYNTVTSLFGFFRDRASREVLSRVLLVYSQTDLVMGEVATLCADLNSFNDTRLDEPDYDRRLRAFTSIVKPREMRFTARQWRPLLYNMLFYIKHEEEFGILSSNSSDGICKFLDDACKGLTGPEKQNFQSMLSSIVLPAIYSGVREESEMIRREYLKVMAHVVRNFPEWTDVSDMYGLLGGDDELESSFFNNILTTGKGRQSRALGQLAAATEKGTLSSRNVSQFFIPLIEHFIFDRDEGSDAHNLAAEATIILGLLAGSLEWPQYRALLTRFIGYITSKPDLGKQIIRLLGKVIDALALAVERKLTGSHDMEEPSLTDLPLVSVQESSQTKPQSALMNTLPKQAKFTEDLTSNILPPLSAYLHDKEESTVSLRVPVAVVVVRLLKLLPLEQMTERLPAVLTDICHILRSKSQESRDMTRDTLTKICVILGPTCFGFVLKELRGALARGYQLHVLSYTMHSILVATTPEYSPGDLDYCLPSIVAVIMDDIFGATGQEKDAEEYVSKMKEVKSSKSHDSMELIAKTATLSRLTDLIRPIQVLLQEKLNLRMVRKIDELLSRISNGLLKNSAAQSRESLIFCYEVIQDVYASSKPHLKAKEDYRLKKYLVQRSANKSGNRGGTTIYTYKLARFALDVMRSVLKKYDNLRTASNIAGFVPILGDALVQAEDEVKVATFRLLGTISKVPLQFTSDGTNLYKIAAQEGMRSILSSSSTTSDVSQAALKLLSVILRDRGDVKVKETSIDDVLGRLKDDITDPERRHVTFNFLRSMLDSKLESAAVYDTLDYVGTVMVTNDDKDTRDLARGTYFQFLKGYPQKKNRWSKQLAFIVANLKYDREGGRLSILEVIHLLLSKSSNDFVQEVSATCFVPLIFVLINDESEKCRTAAGEVIKEIFRKANKERVQTFLDLMRSWITQHENLSVMRLGFLSYALYFEALREDERDVDILLSSILEILRDIHQPGSDWELIYAALQLTSTLCQTFPSRLMSAVTAGLWPAIRTCLTFPHAWVKLSSAMLMTIYFADFAKTNAEDGLQNLPIQGSRGLRLNADDIMDLIRRFAGIFNTPGLTELLATEVIKNLLFLGRCAGASNLKWVNAHETEVEDLDDEDEGARDKEGNQQTALDYLLRRLSFVLRRETSPPRAPALIPKIAAHQLLQMLCTKLAAGIISPSLQTILLPLHNLTDPNIPTPYSTDDLFKAGYEALKANSQELMSLLQIKCGIAEYTAQLLKVREGVKARRTERSSKRKIEVVAAPEKFGRDKKKKVERKKERRKEKGLEHREQRRGQF
jgi:U3 small nucleolar RNA-associated protein 20